MGRGAVGRAGTAAERGERARRGAGRAARTHRAPAHRRDANAADAPTGGRAAAGLGRGAARVGRVRAERRHAIRGGRLRVAAFCRPRGRAQHARCAPCPRPRAHTLRRPGAGAGRGGGPSAGRRGARVHRGRRSERRDRALGDARAAAAALARFVPGAGARVPPPCRGRLAARGAGLTACGRPPGNGGGGGRGGAAGSPAAGRPGRGAARHRAATQRARAVRRGRPHRRAGRGRARRRARVGPPAGAPGPAGGSAPAPRALDSHVSRERGGARGAARARAREGGDSEVMKRRNFLKQLSGYVATGLSGDMAALLAPYRSRPLASVLVPMDDAQGDHLKAYRVTYRVVQAAIKAESLLKYRGGSFLLPDGPAIRRDAALAGVTVESVDDARVTAIRGEIEASNMDAVPLEKAPKVAVYVPPNAPPWDDAVTMALQYAGIPFDKVWDFEVMSGKLSGYDWLHLHHEDFTAQYSKFYLIYAGAPWLAEMVRFNADAAKQLRFATVPDLKKAVARQIRDYVGNGGFLFAMCTATETLDLALAAERVDIAAAFADGTPMDPQAESKLDWTKALAFTGAHVEPNPQIASFSDIDGHQVNAPARRQPLGAFKLFNFSAKIDPVPTLLVQNHRQVIPDFYGPTTSFLRSRLKPTDVVLADEEGAPWVKYINGNHGKGTWTFFGGHDPEDQQHQIGDPPTDLSLHPHSPAYRLILNNVLFPAAKKRELKT